MEGLCLRCTFRGDIGCSVLLFDIVEMDTFGAWIKEAIFGNEDLRTSLWDAAVKAEHEECAKACEKYMLEQYGNHYGVANAIRNRK